MMKIFNDPLYGLINVPNGILFDLIEHHYFQRLRRISQLGMTHYVYPGAVHSRFNHALGAFHLSQKAVYNLRSKGVKIKEEEEEALLIAILLHDIGHGPFSHLLELCLIQVHHEALTLALMRKLNQLFKGKLDLSIQIFTNQYKKRFLHQLVSGQLDMDRMDYLSRDSFFTGVLEGRVAHDRLLQMLNVHEDELVVEYKGIYSVENFLEARRSMYWQVYLHKTVLVAGKMLVKIFHRVRDLLSNGVHLDLPESLVFFLKKNYTQKDLNTETELLLKHFVNLDDYDIVHALKNFQKNPDFILSYLAKNLLKRRLLKIRIQSEEIAAQLVEDLRLKAMQLYGIHAKESAYLVFLGSEKTKPIFLTKMK